MKITLRLIILFLFFTIFTYSLSATPLFYETLTQITTPESLAHYMKEHFRYREDEKLFGAEDYWQTPEEFFDRGVGDCEDYAVFARDILARHGYEAFVVSIYDGSGALAHTIAVFEDKTGFQAMNEDKLIRLNSSSIQDVIEELYPGWAWGAIAEEHDHRGWSTQEFWNSRLKS